MKLKVKKLKVKKDSRGWLSEIIRPEDIKKVQFGQLILTVSYPLEIRANHYHKRKTEWYCVVRGKAALTIVNNRTGERKEITMGEDNLSLVEIPPNHLHYIKNIGDEKMYLLVYVNEAFNPLDSDTYYLDSDIEKKT